METGTTVNVIYDPQHPSDAQIADFTQFWLGPVVIVSIGLITLLMAVGAFIVIDETDKLPVAAADMQRQVSLMARSDRILVNGWIVRTEPAQGKNGKFVFICSGTRPDGTSPEEFVSEPFDDNFSSSQDIKNRLIGHSVEIYIAPDDKDNYYVNIIQEIAKLLEKA